ncbi:sulfatase-like protein [Herbihabitans rhizosphaerae]|uniref:Sulfatase-like protein n=1 Tax=Herbihabitans rhizosphaerae TaxID=1872711 RepID=A0A4Q7KCJ3_9PSEU|nr:sulfatase-like hydrolase/transferase [Herbihabitans rhizosphaerae]RZS30386.1 sulfatase-like protein [Herbihabitans rhizosphaerae]
MPVISGARSPAAHSRRRVLKLAGAGIPAVAGGAFATRAAFGAPEAAAGVSRKPGGDVRRVIVFHMDSLHHEAPERLGLENFPRVAECGTRVAECLTISPWHPTVSGYWPLSTTSFPNPTTFAGSVFLQPWQRQRYLQHCFDGHTAHIANSEAYRSLNPGFDFVRLNNDDTDEDNVRLGLRQLSEHADLTFMRLLLQDANAASQQVANAPAGMPWARDVYATGSPYPEVVRKADALLGTFLDGLRRMGMLDDTLLVVLADGQSRYGWHPVQAEDSWRLPLVFAGPGVAEGRTVPYAENIDIAPTVAALAGVPAPSDDGGSGRVLDGVRAAGRHRDVPRRIERINRQIVEYLRLEGWMRAHARAYPFLDVRLMAAHNGLLTDAQFWSLDRVDEWPQAGSLDRMIADNQFSLDLLNRALRESGAPPLPA